jgi:hypothetical protein
MKFSFRLVVLLILLILIVTGCDDGATPTRPARPTVAVNVVGTPLPPATTAIPFPAITATPPAKPTVPPTTPPPTPLNGIGLPIYNALTPLNLGGLEQQLAQSLTGQGGSNLKYKVFSTTETSANVLAFYESELKKIGYNKSVEQDIPPQPGLSLKGKIVGYQKSGGNGAIIATIGPLNNAEVALFTTSAPESANQLKSGDLIVLLFNDLG